MPDDASNIPFIHSVNSYLKAGWKGTIPLPPGAKGPPPKGFTGAQGKYPDIQQIKKWCDPKDSQYLGGAQIALRLGEVDLSGWTNMPVTYAGHIVTGWELIGIDVDTYKEKHGYRQLLKLQEELGALPVTLRSSSRWDRGTTSYIAVYLVPKGFRYLGKAAGCIEVIQKRHRYMVVWPSRNPDADNNLYEWLASDDGSVVGVPTLAGIAILPESWWGYLSNNGQPESDDPISDLTGGELLDWAVETWRDSQGDMCADMAAILTKWADKIESAAECHPLMVPAQWEILRYGAEGHSGWLTALKQLNTIWVKHAREQRDGPVPDSEVRRGVIGAMGKIQPVFTHLADDPCECKEAVRNGEYDDKINEWGYTEACGCGNPDCGGCEAGARVAASDNGGLGPVVGKLQVVKDKPVDDYGQHDEGNGQHFIDLYGDNVKFISARRNWAMWTPADGSPGSGRWHADFENKYVALAYRRVRIRQEQYAHGLTLQSVQDKDNKQIATQARSWRNWAKRSGDVNPIRNALQSSERLYVDDNTPVTMNGKEFDAHPRLLGCANGVLELTEDPELREPRREDFVTYNTGIPYIPWRTLATTDDFNLDGYHLWFEYLNMFLPDPEIRHFVHKVMGHLLVGENPEKLLIFLYGPHDTGKSTMIGAIAGALGDYYGTIDMNIFKQHDKNPQLVRAVPLRVTGMSEVDAGVMDAATVKRLTGNDQVVAELKYSNDIFVGRPQFTTLIACNNPPAINHADEALRERILALPFSTTIERSKRVYERQTEIEHYSGVSVLSWLVEGWRLYCTEGIKRDSWPKAVKALHGELVSDLNPTQSFVSAMLLKSRECEEGIRAENEAIRKGMTRNRRTPTASDWPLEWTPSASSIYEMYVRWMNANGAPALSLPNFGKELGLGRPAQRKVDGENRKCYVGVMIRP